MQICSNSSSVAPARVTAAHVFVVIIQRTNEGIIFSVLTFGSALGFFPFIRTVGGFTIINLSNGEVFRAAVPTGEDMQVFQVKRIGENINELPKGIFQNNPCRLIFTKTNRHIKSIARVVSNKAKPYKQTDRQNSQSGTVINLIAVPFLCALLLKERGVFWIAQCF